MSWPALAVRRGWGLALLALCLAAGLATAADHEDAYRQGMSAVDQKKWSVAAAAFRAAIAAHPPEGGKKIRLYGTWLVDYLPHYYLGVALAQLGDAEGAAEAWRESRRQGAILGTPLAADLARRESQLPPPARAPAPTIAEVPEPPAAVAGDAVEVRPAIAPPTAPSAADPGTGAGAPASAEISARTAGAAPVRSEPAARPPEPVPDPRAKLLAAARLYFGGDYRGALRALPDAKLAGPEAARICLLRAAASFALARESGPADPRYLDDARRALGDCPGLARGARPDPRLFSPVFTRFVEASLGRK